MFLSGLAPRSPDVSGDIDVLLRDFSQDEAVAFANASLSRSLLKTELPTIKAALMLQKMAYEFACPDSTGLSMDKPWLQDRVTEKPNNFYNQTKKGLVFEVYYGQPGKIWTPYGSWGCWGSGAGHFPMDKFLARFKHKLLTPEIRNSMGCYGPWYVVEQVGDIEVPAYEPCDPKMFLPGKLTDELWKRAVEQIGAV